ncbi:response regulator [Bacteriovorax sp. Seq25_V]|uniref:response regulator n=1 Tax=Bacteriovorax sp. Seq25_V TaxID=1201288 RepID=UPI000389FAA9|nr:response regulator [Bacteriovorax sp. Seq25_V]EQC45554.1 putative chemotaxis protein Chey [Bacteriovorax sp. Seq25_V]
MANKLLDEIKVLVVDDMATLRESIVTLLRGVGFTKVSSAQDGVKALLKIEDAYNEKEPYRLILSDINMPECNGIELLKKLKADDRFKDIPVVMISTENEAATVMDAIQAGAVNYILKPFTTETLKAKLNEIGKFLK